MRNWEITLGIKPMMLFGYRSYSGPTIRDYVLYVGCFDICYSVWWELD